MNPKKTPHVAAKKSTAAARRVKKPVQGKPAGRVSATANSVEKYIAGIPEASRKTFDALRAAVRQTAPKDAEEVLSYGIPALRTHQVLVWYAAFAQHCSLFPTASVLAEFREELKEFRISKGTVQFPLGRPVPVTLVKKLVRARMADAQKKR